MLAKIEAEIKNGNQITGYQHFWANDPIDYLPECKILGEVTEEELLADPASAEEAYCGDGDSVRTLDEVVQFVNWLIGHDYPINVAMQCAANLLVLHAD